MATATRTRMGKKNVFRLAKQQLCTCIMLFLYISLLLLHHHNVKVPKFMFCREHEHKTTTLFFFSWTLIHFFNRIQLQKNLMNWTSWNKCNKVWSSMNSLFKWRFHSRRSRCCLSSLIVIVAKVIWKMLNIEQNELNLTEVIIFFSYSFCFFNINYHQSCLLIVYNEVRPFAISNLLLLL